MGRRGRRRAKTGRRGRGRKKREKEGKRRGGEEREQDEGEEEKGGGEEKERKERNTRVKPERANCLRHKLFTLLVGCLDFCNLLVGTRAQNFNETLFVCPHPLHCFTQ